MNRDGSISLVPTYKDLKCITMVEEASGQGEKFRNDAGVQLWAQNS